MISFKSLGIGLSLAFSCLLLGLIAEIYYLLWWKKRGGLNNEELQDGNSISSSSSSSRELFYFLCFKKPSSLNSTSLNSQDLMFNGNEQDTHLQFTSNSNKEVFLNPFGGDSIEAELMRLHNLAGPPRLLFTINEETKEDLESEDGRSRAGDKHRKVSRSLADLLLAIDTPMASPRLTTSTPPMTPLTDSSNNQHGFNSLFESSVDPEMHKRRASPPPKFKFLIDAEEKLHQRRVIEDAMKRVQRSTTSFEDHEGNKAFPNSSMVVNGEDGSFIRIIVDKSEENTQIDHSYHHSSSSQILPLSSSPSSTRPPNRSSKD